MDNPNQAFVGAVERAIALDEAGQLQAAITSYLEAYTTIIRLVDEERLPINYRQVARNYLERAENLRKRIDSEAGARDKAQLELEKAAFLLNQAIASDERGNHEAATELYAKAAEFCIAQGKACADAESRKQYHRLAEEALTRAESAKKAAKGIAELSKAAKAPNPIDTTLASGLLRLQLPPSPSDPASIHPSASFNAVPEKRTLDERHPKPSGGGELDAMELKVLASTSNINGLIFVPFMAHDLNERFSYPIPFTDRDGVLKLSEKQRKKLKHWARPDEFTSTPTLIDCIDSGTIKQTIVSDCSFVASLAIAARYERRFGTQLITNIIYPQNKKGQPVYNPSGKYMVRLHLNGIARKVIIDDLLPVGLHGELLCSYSQHGNELWVSLLEKAYMKVMGGYDFPGSNSNIDLHALTGWIPERIPIRPGEESFNADKVFERLFSRFHSGHCLITLATGQMSEEEQQRSGLVDAHAYAVLDLRKFKDKRLLLLKNPWTHIRWKGNYSERDRANWTQEMQKSLNYNPADAQQFDDGVFWIDYASVCHFFDVFYVNWSPALFPFSYVLHASWAAGLGPVKDLYNIGENPQYSLEVNNKHGTASVWILLTRHITDREDFADNHEYITVIVYKSDGKRIYLPHDPKPLIEGVRINSPHYLCQMLVKEQGIQQYTLVVAQYEKTSTIHYTLRVYSSTEFKCGSIRSPYRRNRKDFGEWKGKTAGGCGNGDSRETYLNNPTYHIMLEDGSDENCMLIDLRGPKQYSVGFEINQVSSFRHKPFERRDSGPFRPGCTILQLSSVPAGCYSVRVMTFLRGQEGPFILRVESSCDLSLKRVQ